MMDSMTRRGFLGTGVAASAAFAASQLVSAQDAAPLKPVRVGVVGTGGRGTSLLQVLLGTPGVEVPALCDINVANLSRAQDLVANTGRPKPEGYSRDERVYEELMTRDDLDAVIIATPWNWHTPMAVSAMRHGKYPGVEVPCAMQIEECWDLVNTSEATGIPCMMLENWSFRRDNLAVLNMIRQGLLGEMVHCHCAHSHDCLGYWFFDTSGNERWPAQYLVKYNRDQYPTHSLGPVLSWMDINCGDAFATVTSTATDSFAINRYFTRTYGPDHPFAKRTYAQADIVTSVIRTQKGRTIVVNYDMQLPRPYDNRWIIQGSLGLYDEVRASVYIQEGNTTQHEWSPFGPYQEKYDHPWWKTISAQDGHGGTDSLEIGLFIEAVRAKGPTPIDVYDSVTMSSLIGLSEQSIAQGSQPVACPDFTRGQWKTRKPSFAVVA